MRVKCIGAGWDNKIPGIFHILKKNNVSAIPEAHCYLIYKESTFDIIFPDQITDPNNFDILKEISINPKQIGKHKINFHQKFIRRWVVAEKLSVSHETLWLFREEYIQTLSQAS